MSFRQKKNKEIPYESNKGPLSRNKSVEGGSREVKSGRSDPNGPQFAKLQFLNVNALHKEVASEV